MLRRISQKLLLRPDDVTPHRHDFDVIGVFNPGAVRMGSDTVLLVRVAEQAGERRAGLMGLPRWTQDGEIVIDWMPEDELDRSDPRVVRQRKDHRVRLTSISHLRVFRSRADHSTNWTVGPSLLPQSELEEYGVEDPRITQIDDRFYITYVAVSRYGVSTSLASTTDFVTFERHGVIFCPENKDVVLFPQKVKGQYVALHRPNPRTSFAAPGMWLARSPDLIHWGQHEFLFGGRAEWEADRVGAGAPPIASADGWLEVYHGSGRASREGRVGAYSAGAVLLDRDNPARILGRTSEPIMRPTDDCERAGFVANVVFPTAIIERDESLLVHYGAADTFTGVVEFFRDDVLRALH
jgi:predicted GH43/DUF377 family glycosyl hydrolase